jgi:hypothetical protein
MLCTASHVIAAQDGEVVAERGPAKHFMGVSPHQSPVRLSPTTPPRNYRTLKVTGPLEAHQLLQFKDRDCREIYLNGVYEVYEEAGTYVNNGPITISPDTFNPDVEVLSLTVCGLGPEQIKRIGEFKKLRQLILDCNGRLKEEGILSILPLTVTSLSLLSTGLTNAALREILKMPNIVELDIRQNKDVTDEMADSLLHADNLKILKVAGTGLSRKVQRQIEDKYKLVY